MLGSLPDSYDIFLSSLNARDADNMDWEQIRPLLIKEYMKRKQREERHDEDALLVRRNTNTMGRHQEASFQGPPNNDYRRQYFPEARWQDGGRGAKRGRGGYNFPQSNNRGNRFLCFKCDEPGHKAQFCPRKMKKEEGFFCSSADGEESSSSRDAKRRKVSEDDDESFMENAVALTSDTFCCV